MDKSLKLASSIAAALMLSACNSSSDGPVEDGGSAMRPPVVSDSEVVNKWFEPAADRVDAIKASQTAYPMTAKNIILFIGDGMGLTTHTAGRIYAAQSAYNKGEYEGFEGGEEFQTSFEQFPHFALSKTYASNGQTPDSGSTMSAIMSGVKINKYALNVSDEVQIRDCVDLEGKGLLTAMDLANLAKMSTGVVTNTRVTHATPAGTYASISLRDVEDDTNGAKCEGTYDIAEQLVHYQNKFKDGFQGIQTDLESGIDVVLGGGARSFFPDGEGGRRRDGQNLVETWKDLTGGTFVADKYDLEDVTQTPVFGLFNFTHMEYEVDREVRGDEPSLIDMTEKAIELLQAHDNENGFFLVIEGGRIDQAHHAGWGNMALAEYEMFIEAVQRATDMVNLDETMVLVTADHSHTDSISGNVKRGNPIAGLAYDVEGEVRLANDGLPFTTRHYANSDIGGQGGALDGNSRTDLSNVDTEKLTFKQPAAVKANGGGETHAGEDVGIWATGAGSAHVRGVLEQNSIFHIINKVGQLEQKASQQL
ncbi:alkaline phosphatase [Vibrio astriarenae]